MRPQEGQFCLDTGQLRFRPISPLGFDLRPLGFSLRSLGFSLRSLGSVSYTHLTLPTSDLVSISVVAGSFTNTKITLGT